MASSMKDIKLRIHSVESTMQITRAMELVAASKLRRAQERMERSRPYFADTPRDDPRYSRAGRHRFSRPM